MKFEGSYVALVTPFDSKGHVDESAYRDLIRRQIRSGTRGLVPCGSTGEAATMTHEEFRRAITIALEESRGDVPVMVGVASNATWKAVELAREAGSLGADALLALAPYYNKPTQEGLYAHFHAVARETRLPVMLYNIPSRCAVNIEPATIARLARDCSNIVAVKEASGNLDQVSEILRLGPSLTVMSGDDALALPMLTIGARGIVSVVANIAPKQTQALCEAFFKGDLDKARSLHRKLFPLIKALFLETNPIPVKAALGLMGLCRPDPRLPLTPLSTSARTVLEKTLEELGFL